MIFERPGGGSYVHKYMWPECIEKAIADGVSSIKCHQLGQTLDVEHANVASLMGRATGDSSANDETDSSPSPAPAPAPAPTTTVNTVESGSSDRASRIAMAEDEMAYEEAELALQERRLALDARKAALAASKSVAADDAKSEWQDSGQ